MNGGRELPFLLENIKIVTQHSRIKMNNVRFK